jgi:hypothetical protein
MAARPIGSISGGWKMKLALTRCAAWRACESGARLPVCARVCSPRSSLETPGKTRDTL